MNSSEQELLEEDLEMFLDEYQPPNIKEWTSEMLEHYLNSWFIENANPLQEDLESMQKSLLHLIRFLHEKTLIPTEVGEVMIPRLEDPLRYTKKLSLE